MKRDARIYVAGHTGMVGSAIVRALEARGFTKLITRTRSQLNLTCQRSVAEFFAQHRPEYVFMAAAKVGGIVANRDNPAGFLMDNLAMELNVMGGAAASGVKKLLFLGSSCIYPKHAEQPIREEALLSGPLEPTNEWYAVAKIAGIKMCQALRRQYGCDFISVMPCNLYGPGDNYHPEHSHVIPGMIDRFHKAKVAGHAMLPVWGTGLPTREFLYVDDLARACLLLMDTYGAEQPINAGSGEEVSIAMLSGLIKHLVGYQGEIRFDPEKPDGTPRKVMDSSRLRALGWEPTIKMRQGLVLAYADYCGRHRPSAMW